MEAEDRHQRGRDHAGAAGKQHDRGRRQAEAQQRAADDRPGDAAQAADAEGYLNTYVTLMCPDTRWGANGGNQLWSHEEYDAGKSQVCDLATRARAICHGGLCGAAIDNECPTYRGDCIGER